MTLIVSVTRFQTPGSPALVWHVSSRDGGEVGGGGGVTDNNCVILCVSYYACSAL